MAELIRMPKLSDTMTEGVITEWHKKVGDTIVAGDILADVETDKATMELEAFEDGTLLHINIEKGNAVPVDSIIAILGEKGESFKELLTQEVTPSQKEEPMEKNTTPSASIDTSKINAAIIAMPKLTDTMTEGIITAWHKKVGDIIAVGDVIAEVETDKATMDVDSFEDGELLYIGPKAGDGVPIDDVIAIIGEKNADYKTLLKAHEQSKSSSTTADDKPKEQQTQASMPASATAQPATNTIPDAGQRVFASPLAKRIALDKNIDITQVQGTGENGRVIKRDLENYTPQPKAAVSKETAISLPTVVGKESTEEITHSSMRKTIARRLSESKFTAPHYYLTMDINMDKAIEARKSLNEVAPVKISFNDIVLKATASALRKNPDINVYWTNNSIIKNHHIHIGVAVAIEDGLVVPVIRFADNKSLSHISVEVKDLAKKAMAKELQPNDWEGNTFTISNLGMFGIEEFTSIINQPESCILAIGAIKNVPIVKDNQVVPGNVMRVTLSCDHRAVDGATGAAFLQTLKQLLEDPIRILA